MVLSGCFWLKSTSNPKKILSKSVQKAQSKTFLHSTLFLFSPLFPKYQHFLAEIQRVAVAWALQFHFTLFSLSFKFLILRFWHSNFFYETPFSSWLFWTYIVTIKYELYQNLGLLKSILKSPKAEGGWGVESTPLPLYLGLNTHPIHV